MSRANRPLLAVLAWCYTTRPTASLLSQLSPELNVCKESDHVFASEHDPRSIPDRGDLSPV